MSHQEVNHTFKLVDSKGEELAYVSAPSYLKGFSEINEYKNSFKDLNPKIIYKKK